MRPILAYSALLGLAVAAVAAKPVAFQKANTIVATQTIEPIRSKASLDVAARLSAIPYHAGADEVVWAVEPRERYHQTVVAGRGNCSNLVFGIAYELDRRGLDFQVIHLLPSNFLDGAGHTVLRTRYHYDDRDRVGVVDLLEGGLPMSAGHPLDVGDLEHGAVAGFSLVPLSAQHDDRSTYYGTFLSDARVGYASSEDVGAYFRFVESIYVPLGSARLEKYIYDGLSVLAGKYPSIRTPAASDLFSGKRAERAALIAACWTLRSAFVVVPAYLVLAVARTISRRVDLLSRRGRTRRAPVAA